MADGARAEQELEALFGSLLDGLYAFALGMVGQPHQAEEITQTVLARALPRLIHGEVGNPTTYLRRAAYREVIGQHRRRGVERRHRHHWRVTTASGSDPNEAEVDDRLAFRPYLIQLPPRQRAILLMRFWDDLPPEEIAETLGVKVSTVKTHINRGLARLRSILEDGDGL